MQAGKIGGIDIQYSQGNELEKANEEQQKYCL